MNKVRTSLAKRSSPALSLAVASLAKEIRASVKTVHRDLYALRDLGQESYVRRNADGTYVRFYVRGVEPLFSCNRRRVKKRR